MFFIYFSMCYCGSTPDQGRPALTKFLDILITVQSHLRPFRGPFEKLFSDAVPGFIIEQMYFLRRHNQGQNCVSFKMLDIGETQR